MKNQKEQPSKFTMFLSVLAIVISLASTVYSSLMSERTKQATLELMMIQKGIK